MTISLLGFGFVLLLALAGLPIALSMLAVGFLGFAWVVDWAPALAMTGQIAWETSLNYGLSVLPMFILMGNFLNQGRLSAELYEASNAFVGHYRGGLAMATIIACGGFSAVCGSSLATAATMSKVSMPPMRSFGYSDGLAAGSVAAGGTLGILIPPSTVFVIYGILTQSDIGKLFAAGVLPGILAVALFCAAIAVVVHFNPAAGPRGKRTPWNLRLRALGRIWGMLAIFVLVIGGIYVGAFTPTEAAGIGAFGAFVFVVSRVGFSWRALRAVAIETARTTSVMFMVLIGALVFSNFINVAGMSTALGDLVKGLDIGRTGFVLTILLIYLILGCVFESMSMVLLTVPVFYPIAQQNGIDPIWFGVIVVVGTEISLITPPVGLNVFVIKGIYRELDTATIFRGVMPFVIADFLLIALILVFPEIATWLPSHMN